MKLPEVAKALKILVPKKKPNWAPLLQYKNLGTGFESLSLF